MTRLDHDVHDQFSGKRGWIQTEALSRSVYSSVARHCACCVTQQTNRVPQADIHNWHQAGHSRLISHAELIFAFERLQKRDGCVL